MRSSASRNGDNGCNSFARWFFFFLMERIKHGMCLLRFVPLLIHPLIQFIKIKKMKLHEWKRCRSGKILQWGSDMGYFRDSRKFSVSIWPLIVIDPGSNESLLPIYMGNSWMNINLISFLALVRSSVDKKNILITSYINLSLSWRI